MPPFGTIPLSCLRPKKTSLKVAPSSFIVFDRTNALGLVRNTLRVEHWSRTMFVDADELIVPTPHSFSVTGVRRRNKHARGKYQLVVARFSMAHMRDG
jgi:hypothetical protein